MKKSYVPRPDEDFDGWQDNFGNEVNLNAVAWEIPSDEVVRLQGEQSDWNTTFAAGGKGHKTTRTSEQIKAKTEARRSYEKTIRIFVKRWIDNNPLISDAQRKALRVTINDTVRTRMPIPSGKPVCTNLNSSEHLQLVLEVRDERSPRSRKKPVDATAYELWGQLTSPAQPKPIDDSGFAYIKSFTAHKAKLSFPQGTSGSTLSFHIRWKNSHEETGPWSDIYTALIT